MDAGHPRPVDIDFTTEHLNPMDSGYDYPAQRLPPGLRTGGMASTSGGKGYWLVASDGGIFTFGDRWHGARGTADTSAMQESLGGRSMRAFSQCGTSPWSS